MNEDQHPFVYHKPTDAQTSLMQACNEHFHAAYDELLNSASPSAARTQAIVHLMSARMWANAAILGVQIEPQPETFFGTLDSFALTATPGQL